MPKSKRLTRWHVEVSKSAEFDIDEVVDYFIESGELDHADKILNEFELAKESLATLPDRGHYPEEFKRIRVSSHKEIHFGFYRLIYHIDAALGWVFVDAVLDGRRDVELLLTDRILRVAQTIKK